MSDYVLYLCFPNPFYIKNLLNTKQTKQYAFNVALFNVVLQKGDVTHYNGLLFITVSDSSRYKILNILKDTS